MGCVSSRQPRHSPLVNQEDDPDPWHTESSISLSGIPLKVVIVGDEGVGKTSFVLRVTNQKFDASGAVKTIGIDFWRHVINVDGENISLQIWDTAGDTKFTKIAETYYKSAHGFLVAFSTADKKQRDVIEPSIHLLELNSFHRISSYVERIQQLNNSDNPVMLLVGTKCDEQELRQVDIEEVQQIASQYKIQYFEVSSKDNINIQKVVITLIKLITENPLSHAHMLN